MAFSMLFNSLAKASLPDDTQQLFAARQKTQDHNMNNALNFIILSYPASR
jgi:hypothetical protein